MEWIYTHYAHEKMKELYGDIIFDQEHSKSFHDTLQWIQYNAALAITGAIRGTLREKLYQELRLESLQQRHWFCKLCTLYKIYKNQFVLLQKLLLLQTSSCITRSSNNIPCFHFKHDFFKKKFSLL